MTINMFDTLEQVIDPHFKIVSESGSFLKVIETQQGAKCKDVTLKKTKKTFAFTLDKSGKDPFPFFKDLRGIKCKNDAIIFYESNNKRYIFIIELKSDNPYDGIPQLKAGERFVNFLIKTISIYDKSFPTEFEIKYIIFHTKKSSNLRSSKKTTKAVYRSSNGIDVAFVLGNCNYDFDFFV